VAADFRIPLSPFLSRRHRARGRWQALRPVFPAVLLAIPAYAALRRADLRLGPEAPGRSPDRPATLAALVSALRARCEAFRSSPGLRQAYDSFLADHRLEPGSISYSDFAVVRTLFEATRDAGFWNLHWSVTDQPPNSDRIWSQWTSIERPAVHRKTATAECDELSALFAFLAARSGIKGVGLFWPYPNHTVAVWSVHPGNGPGIRVVIPTSQIFLSELDTFDTRKFDPWRQKTIYDYTRRDVPDGFELPGPLFDYFLSQLDKYGGASTAALQQIRNLRDGVLAGSLAPERAAREALRLGSASGWSPEDHAAFERFAGDLRSSAAASSPRPARVDSPASAGAY